MTAEPSALAAALEQPDEMHRCPFGQWLDDLADSDPDYHKMVQTALDRIVENRARNGKTSRGWTAVRLARELSKDGHTEWTGDIIGHHLRGVLRNAGCRCRG